MMTAIHTLWPTIAALEALLPVARVFTGRVPAGVAFPRAAITRPGSTGDSRTNDSLYRTVSIQISVWVKAAAYLAGEAIQEAIEDGFSAQGFSTTAGRALDVLIENSFSMFEDDPVNPLWQFVTTLAITEGRSRVQ